MNVLTQQVIDAIRRRGYTVEWEDLAERDGRTNITRKTCIFNTLMDEPRALHVAAHELAHIVADEIGEDTTDETVVEHLTVTFLAGLALKVASPNVGRITWNGS